MSDPAPDPPPVATVANAAVAPGSRRSTPLDPDRYRAVLGRFATGITVVTTMDGPQPFGTTVNAFSSVSLDPPLVLVTIGQERSIRPVITRTGRFAVNILAEDGQYLSDCFAGAPTTIPRTAFCGATYHLDGFGQPLLDDALAWVSCELDRVIDAGDHAIVLGRVVKLAASDRADWPLLYYRRQYLRIERAETAELRGKPDGK
jgi:3-hydroxy-9,10-secoandrosta-1,3,5(10)-triene-9,17-dione monooxygenase reductase component